MTSSTLYVTEPPSKSKYCIQEYFIFACTVKIFREFFNFGIDFSFNGCDLLFRNYLRSLPRCKIVPKIKWQVYDDDNRGLYTHILKTDCNHATFTVDLNNVKKYWHGMAKELKYIHSSFNENTQVFKDIIDDEDEHKTYGEFTTLTSKYVQNSHSKEKYSL